MSKIDILNKLINDMDKEIKELNDFIITKLYSNGVGTPCHPQDVAVVVSELSDYIKWSLK